MFQGTSFMMRHMDRGTNLLQTPVPVSHPYRSPDAVLERSALEPLPVPCLLF